MKKLNLILIGVIISIFIISLVSADLYNPTDNWQLNENSGNTTAGDLNGGKPFTTNLTAGNFGTGKLGNAFRTSLSTNGIILNTTGSSNFAFGTGVFSFGFWFNGTKSTGSYVLQSYNGGSTTGYQINQQNNAFNFDFINGGVTIASTGDMVQGSWHRLWFVREGTGASQFKVYIDNNNVVNGTLNSDITDTSSVFSFFASNQGAGTYFDDIRIYKGYALTVADINQDWNNGYGWEIAQIYTTSTLDSPTTNIATLNNTLNFSSHGVVIANGSTLNNATLYIYNSTTTIFNQTTIEATNMINYTNFTVSGFAPGNYIWNVLYCGSNSTATACMEDTNRTFIWGIEQQSINFTTPVYETSRSLLNFSVNVSAGTPTGYLWWNGTRYSSTASLLANGLWYFEKLLGIPSGPGTKNLFWEVQDGVIDYNSSNYNQVVSATNLSICGSGPQNIPFMNFTFVNETGLNYINATLTGLTFTYYDVNGDGTITNTLVYTNAIPAPSYAFCKSPGAINISVTGSFQYYADSFPTRRYSLGGTTFSNDTTNTTLYLLDTSNGLYQQFVAIDSLNSSSIPNVLVQLQTTVGTNTVVIASGYTDSGGSVTFWLDPNTVHTYSATKSGYSALTGSITPTGAIAYLYMNAAGSSAGVPNYGNGINITTGLTYNILPVNDTLTNETDYTFAFNVSNPTLNYTSMSMNITNSSGYQIYYSAQAGQGTLSTIINTGLNTSLYGYFKLVNGNESITFTKVWTVGNYYEGAYSLWAWAKEFTIQARGYSGNAPYFLQWIIMIAVIIAVAVGFYQVDAVDSASAAIGGVMVATLVFGYLGWIPGTTTVYGTAAVVLLIEILGTALIIWRLKRD